MTHPDEIPATVPDEIRALARGCFCPKELTPSEAPLTLWRIERMLMADRASHPDTPAVEGEGYKVGFVHHDHVDRLVEGGHSEQATIFRVPPFPEAARHYVALYTHPAPTQDVSDLVRRLRKGLGRLQRFGMFYALESTTNGEYIRLSDVKTLINTLTSAGSGE